MPLTEKTLDLKPKELVKDMLGRLIRARTRFQSILWELEGVLTEEWNNIWQDDFTRIISTIME